jgi:hypothetical protein
MTRDVRRNYSDPSEQLAAIAPPLAGWPPVYRAQTVPTIPTDDHLGSSAQLAYPQIRQGSPLMISSCFLADTLPDLQTRSLSASPCTEGFEPRRNCQPKLKRQLTTLPTGRGELARRRERTCVLPPRSGRRPLGRRVSPALVHRPAERTHLLNVTSKRQHGRTEHRPQTPSQGLPLPTRAEASNSATSLGRQPDRKHPSVRPQRGPQAQEKPVCTGQVVFQSKLRHLNWGALQAGDTAFHQQRNALQMESHRKHADDDERQRDPLRSAALRRRNRPLTCDDAVLGDCGRRSGVAGLCESKRAHSEPSCQRAPTVTNDCSQPPWHRTTETARRQVELYYDI